MGTPWESHCWINEPVLWTPMQERIYIPCSFLASCTLDHTHATQAHVLQRTIILTCTVAPTCTPRERHHNAGNVHVGASKPPPRALLISTWLSWAADKTIGCIFGGVLDKARGGCKCHLARPATGEHASCRGFGRFHELIKKIYMSQSILIPWKKICTHVMSTMRKCTKQKDLKEKRK
jgi:hypothetical protein